VKGSFLILSDIREPYLLLKKENLFLIYELLLVVVSLLLNNLTSPFLKTSYKNRSKSKTISFLNSSIGINIEILFRIINLYTKYVPASARMISVNSYLKFKSEILPKIKIKKQYRMTKYATTIIYNLS
jgi:hypothetical protein